MILSVEARGDVEMIKTLRLARCAGTRRYNSLAGTNDQLSPSRAPSSALLIITNDRLL